MQQLPMHVVHRCPFWKSIKSLPLIVLVWVTSIPASALHAQTWSGLGGNNLWSNPANWIGGVPATNSANIFFRDANSTGGTVSVDTPTAYRFGANSNSVFELNSQTNGNAFRLMGQDLIFENQAGLNVFGSGNVIDNNLRVGRDAFGNTILRINGDGTSRLTLNGNLTDVNAGSLGSNGINISQALVANGTVNFNGRIDAFRDVTVNGSFGAFGGGGFFAQGVRIDGEGVLTSQVTLGGATSIGSSTANALRATNLLRSDAATVNGKLELASSSTLQIGFGVNNPHTLSVSSSGVLSGQGSISAATQSATIANAGVISVSTIGMGNGIIEGLNGSGGVINSNINSNAVIRNQTLNGFVTAVQVYNSTFNGGGDVQLLGGLNASQVVLNSTVAVGQLQNVQITGNGTILGKSNVLLGFNGPVSIANTVNWQLEGQTNTLNAGVLGPAGSTFGNNVTFAGGILNGTDTQYLVHGNLVVSNDKGIVNVLNQSLRVLGNATVESGARFGISDNRTLTLDNGIDIESGAFVVGTGSIIGDIRIAGILAPGNSAGTIGIDGTIDIDLNATVSIELGGTAAGIGGYDTINGQGGSSALLDGNLELLSLGGFVPGANDSFDIFNNFASISGTFRNTAGGRVAYRDGWFDVTYGSSFVRLSNFSITAVPEPSSCILICVILPLVLHRQRKLARKL